MADITNSSWDQNDDDNDAASPAGAPEGMSPGGVNNTIRAMMGALKRAYVWSETPTTTTGTSTAYVLSYAVAPAALVDGMTHVVLFHTGNGASPTLNINSLGAKPLHYFTGSAWAVVPSGLIKSGMVCVVYYYASAGTYRIRSFPSAVGTATLGGDNTFTGANTFSGAITMSGAAFNEAVRVDVASATTCDIGAAASNYVRITGTTTITGLGTVASGVRRHVVFGGALTLTHNGTSLILPNAGSNITTAAGDTALFISEGSGNWRCQDYQKADGTPLVAYTPPQRAYAYVTVAAGTATIQKQSGFTSVVRDSQGLYTCTLSSAMPDANYRVMVTGAIDVSGGTPNGLLAAENNHTARSTTVFQLVFGLDSSGLVDPNAINIEVFA